MDFTVEHQPVGKLVQQSLGETVYLDSSKPIQSPKTNRDSTGKPVAQEVVVGVLQEEPSSSDSTGKPVAREEQHVQTHDSSGKPESEEAQHIVQGKENREHRETVDQFNLATNDANIDFSVSGIPEETVKRSETMNILNLIRRITRHPQKQAVQNDLDKKQSFNAFSAESKKAIKESGNIEMARGMGSPRQVSNRRRRTREGPEPACVLSPLLPGWHMQGGKDELTSCRGTV